MPKRMAKMECVSLYLYTLVTRSYVFFFIFCVFGSVKRTENHTRRAAAAAKKMLKIGGKKDGQSLWYKGRLKSHTHTKKKREFSKRDTIPPQRQKQGRYKEASI